MAKDEKGSYSFRYGLNYDECYEAFYLLAFRRSRRFKRTIGTALTLLAVVLLTLFYLDPTRIHYAYLAVIAILLLFYLIYMPVLKARKGAKQVAKQKGIYQVSLMEDGSLSTQQGVCMLSGDKNARAIETADLFVIRTDNRQTFCLPKRVMDEKEIEGARKILTRHMKRFLRKDEKM